MYVNIYAYIISGPVSCGSLPASASDSAVLKRDPADSAADALRDDAALDLATIIMLIMIIICSIVVILVCIVIITIITITISSSSSSSSTRRRLGLGPRRDRGRRRNRGVGVQPLDLPRGEICCKNYICILLSLLLL